MIKLIHGDCLIEMEYLIKENIIYDLIIADIPYGVTDCEWDKPIPFDEMWERINKLIKPNGAILLFGREPFSSYLRISNIKNYKYDLIFEKPHPSNPLLAKKRFMSYHENISVFYEEPHSTDLLYENISIFYEKQPNYNPQKVKRLEKDKRKENGNFSFSNPKYFNDPKKLIQRTDSSLPFKHPSSVLKYNRETGYHPTQKPVDLLETLIKSFSNEGENVLDFTMGSGSAGVACKKIKRNFTGIEIVEKYFNIAKERIESTRTNLL